MRHRGQRRDQVPWCGSRISFKYVRENFFHRAGVHGSLNADDTTSPLGASSGSQTS
jgi:hypothetical protein